MDDELDQALTRAEAAEAEARELRAENVRLRGHIAEVGMAALELLRSAPWPSTAVERAAGRVRDALIASEPDGGREGSQGGWRG